MLAVKMTLSCVIKKHESAREARLDPAQDAMRSSVHRPGAERQAAMRPPLGSGARLTRT
ncbi:hypothetical protein [Paenibacillus sp. B01]|uniref:hypothetical protein n=1 Tax=Paenibacillus sp. B01 TaxID=2660554 RepID=UPI00129AEAFB|nr:hypothetical protein [Paenibacillus sp. B01]QGG57359.1 hypothetical protein GE073_18340 [Paenibacillus sp. B01]